MWEGEYLRMFNIMFYIIVFFILLLFFKIRLVNFAIVIEWSGGGVGGSIGFLICLLLVLVYLLF